jgi:flavin reductase (DIM6/NTAB) family NADH-FMN oxidoreductase RutF
VPLNVECRVIDRLDRKIHAVFLGEVIAVRANEGVLCGGLPDVTAVDPIFYAPDFSACERTYAYWGLGDKLGRAFEVGKELASD